MNAQTRKKEADKITVIGMAVNITLSVLKLAAGILGSSAAMVADAMHSLSDLITDGVLMLGVHIGAKPADAEHQFGHARFETLATLVIAVFLILAAAGILLNGLIEVSKVLRGQILPRPGYIAWVMAGISIISKEVLYHATVRVGLKIKSTAVISNAWHHRSDALSSVATFIGIGGAIVLGHKWTVLDPLVAILVSFFIFAVGFKIIKTAADELTDRAIPEDDLRRLKEIVLAAGGVEDMHSVLTRQVGYRMSVSFKISVDKDMPLSKVYAKISRIERMIRKEFGRETFISICPVPFCKK